MGFLRLARSPTTPPDNGGPLPVLGPAVHADPPARQHPVGVPAVRDPDAGPLSPGGVPLPRPPPGRYAAGWTYLPPPSQGCGGGSAFKFIGLLVHTYVASNLIHGIYVILNLHLHLCRQNEFPSESICVTANRWGNPGKKVAHCLCWECEPGSSSKGGNVQNKQTDRDVSRNPP